MSWDSSKQFITFTRNVRVEYGECAFSTTGLTVEVPCKMSKIFGAQLTPKVTSGDVVENLYTDRVITSGAVTVTRECKPITLSACPDADAYITSNDWVNVPVGVCPVAGNISRLRTFHQTAFGGGTPLINLGSVMPYMTLVDTTGGSTTGWVVGELVAQATSLARGILVSASVDGAEVTLVVRPIEGTFAGQAVTGATSGSAMTPDTHVVGTLDADKFITDTNALVMPEALCVGDFGPDDVGVAATANGWAKKDVTAGELILFSTTGGTTSGPGELHVEVEITPTATSGLTFNYAFWGV